MKPLDFERHAATLQEKVDDARKQEAIISSMTAKERRYPKLLNGSRKRRIASGSGTTVEEVNRLIKQHLEMSRMMKQVTKLGQRGIARAGINSLFRR